MARIGKNPARNIKEVPKPQRVTVAIINYIPYLEGYFKDSLKIFSIMIDSLNKNTEIEYDLLIFDNGSCKNVVDYLVEMRQKGIIQYLILSDKNIGKVAAWNYIFGSAPGEFIAYSDADIYFHKGWLSKSLEIFEKFPNVGTVTACPFRKNPQFFSSTISLAKRNKLHIEEEKFIPDEWAIKHWMNSGSDIERFKKTDLLLDDIRIKSNDTYAYACSCHFQFIVRTEVARSIIPLKVLTLVAHNEELFDEAINEKYMRLATLERLTEHIGNSLSGEWGKYAGDDNNLIYNKNKSSHNYSIFQNKLVKSTLIRLYNKIFKLYYLD